MKPVVLILLVAVALAQADYSRENVFARHIAVPPHLPLPNGIPSPRITGGEEASPHSRPYQVALFLPVRGGLAFCGGSVLSERTVLTAAHCVEDLIGPVEVVFGAHYVLLDEPSQIKRNSSNVIIHPGWSSETIRNDVALVIWDEPVVYSAFIKPIDLPRDDSHSYVGDEASLSGWGKDSDDASTISDRLRIVEFPIISNLLCNIAYLGNVHDTNICASGSGGKSSCNGDSGGPLVIGTEQVGIVSFGIALGCEVGWPSVYTRVSKFLSFINDNKV